MLKTDRYQSNFFPERQRNPDAKTGTFCTMLFSLVPLIGFGTNYNAGCCMEPLNQKHVVLLFYHVQNRETNAVWFALFLKGGVEPHDDGSSVQFLIWNCWNSNQWHQNGQPHHAMALLPVLVWGGNFFWLCSPVMARGMSR